MRIGRLVWCWMLLAGLFQANVWAAAITWTRMTGQYPVECTPLKIVHKGKPALLAVNRRGQVMAWTFSGQDIGPEADGAVAQLPDKIGEKPRFWSSTPASIGTKASPLYLFCSNEGLAIALDGDFKEAWRQQLPKDTVYLSSTAVRTVGTAGEAWCLGDKSGTVTALNAQGGVVWQTKLEGAMCNAPLQAFDDGSRTLVLAAVDNKLCCMDGDGKVLWTRDLGGRIISRPELIVAGGKPMIVCGAGEGALFALTLTGEVMWQTPIGDEIDSTIVFLPERGGAGLILCRGLWGGLHAIAPDGTRRWSFRFASKGRTPALVLDADGDGDMEAMVTGYNQHVYVVDHEGRLRDDVRLSGAITTAPLLLAKNQALVVTGNLLAYGIEPGRCRSQYGKTGAARDVSVAFRERSPEQAYPSMLVENPNGTLLRYNVSATVPTDAGRSFTETRGGITSRTHFDVLPVAAPTATQQTVQVEILDEAGHVRRTLNEAFPAQAGEARSLYAGASASVALDGVYQGETASAPLVVGQPSETPCRVRLEVGPLKTADGTVFAGAVQLFEVVRTGTFNGETCADALVELSGSRMLTCGRVDETRVEVSVNADRSAPGVYTGTISIVPVLGDGKARSVPLRIEVLPLALERPFPLLMCTWDYVPNNWFPNRTEAVLDDMNAHGVSIFPRTRCIPKARVNEQGQLAFDYTTLNEELRLLQGRGQILFQLTHPPIEFAAAASEGQKRDAELRYLREWRDYLKTKGLDYGDYAFYPIDEPGLDFGAVSVPTFLDAAQLFREADPKFRIYTDPVPGLSKKDFERIRPFVDVWCPNMRLATGLLSNDPRIVWIQKSGKPIWSYECVGQVKSLSPLLYNRANAWRAYAFGFNGIGFWTHCTQPYDMWYAAKTADDEYTLVYPGQQPVPSVRWEAARLGLQDVAAADLLRTTADGAPNTAASRALKRQAAAELEAAKRDVLQMSDEVFVESRDFRKQGDRRMWHTVADAETYQRHRARIAELTLALKAL